MRWRCQQCRTTFRTYPPGVAPRKRYLPQALNGLCQRYAEETQSSYRQIVRREGKEIRYEAAAAEAGWSEARKQREETRALSASTVWRWIGFLAALWLVMRRRGAKHFGEALALAARSPRSIPAPKYKNRQRRKALAYCLSTLCVILSGKSFTGYETLCASP